jgi:UDP-N-acetylglucosamine acyltransferase
MSMCHVAHDCRIGDGAIVINYAGLTGHVTVGDRATVGGLSGVHPFTRIGEYAYVGGCCKVVRDVPPFMMADGVPATAHSVNVIGMRRGGIDPASRRVIQSAFRILYRSGLAPATAVERIRAELGGHPLVTRLVDFIETSQRGVISGGRRHRAAADLEIEEPIR